MSRLRVYELETPDSLILLPLSNIAKSSDLANQADSAKGAALVGYNGTTVKAKLDQLDPNNDGVVENALNATNATLAANATKLETPRNIAVSGQYTGSASFDGSANATIGLTESAPTWTDFTFGSGWSWNSAGDAADYYPPSWSRRGNLLYLRGKATYAGSLASATLPTTICTIPTGNRPLKRKVYCIFADSTSPLAFGNCTIFVQTNGTIQLITSGIALPATGYHVLFDGFPPIDLT